MKCRYNQGKVVTNGCHGDEGCGVVLYVVFSDGGLKLAPIHDEMWPGDVSETSINFSDVFSDDNCSQDSTRPSE